MQLEYIFNLTALLFVRKNRIVLTKSLFYTTNHILFFFYNCNREQKVESHVTPIWTEGADDVYLQESLC